MWYKVTSQALNKFMFHKKVRSVIEFVNNNQWCHFVKSSLILSEITFLPYHPHLPLRMLTCITGLHGQKYVLCNTEMILWWLHTTRGKKRAKIHEIMNCWQGRCTRVVSTSVFRTVQYQNKRTDDSSLVFSKNWSCQVMISKTLQLQMDKSCDASLQYNLLMF